MSSVRTNSFELAIYAKGNISSPKLALLLPGLLDTKDYPHMRSHVDFLAGKGFFALSFDPPGTWESPGDIKIYTMTNYLKAINELIDHFGNKPTFVMGHSRGGTMAMLAGTTNPHTVAFTAVFSSCNPNLSPRYGDDDDWKTKGFKQSYRDLPSDPSRRRLFKLPYSFIEDQRQYDLLDGLQQCTKPKLFFLGTHDTLVKPGTIRTGYQAAAEPKQLYELDSDHDYRRHPKLIDEVNKVVGDFLNRYRY